VSDLASWATPSGSREKGNEVQIGNLKGFSISRIVVDDLIAAIVDAVREPEHFGRA
jgi:hypothetical protein